MDKLVAAIVIALYIGVPLVLMPDEAPDETSFTFEDGWVCLGDDCRRPSEARALRGRPRSESRVEAYVFTYEREDGSSDYLAFASRGPCERLRGDFAGSACRLHR